MVHHDGLGAYALGEKALCRLRCVGADKPRIFDTVSHCVCACILDRLGHYFRAYDAVGRPCKKQAYRARSAIHIEHRAVRVGRGVLV